MGDVEIKGIRYIGRHGHSVILPNVCLVGGWCMVL